MEDEHRNGERMGDVHTKVDDDNVTVWVHGAVENVLGSATSVKGEEGALKVAVDDVLAVEVVDYTEDGAYDSGGIIVGEPAAREDTVKREVCARLETFDLGG